jgi:gamma-glutamylcyclotransferase (GGCT)/AIG2-like uncharacterized protein YtfP
MKHILVYGSLRKGFHNHRLMERIGAEFQSELHVPGFDMYSLGAFPGVKENPANGQGVEAELYSFPDEGLRQLDGLEGYYEDAPERSMYLRKEVEVDKGVFAIIYVYNGRIDTSWVDPVPTGNWKDVVR